MKSYLFKFKTLNIRIVIAVFFFMGTYSFAQSKAEKKIDAQILTADNHYQNFEIKELMQISQDIISNSEKVNYEKGLAHGYYSRAFVQHNIGNFKKSVFYLKKAQSYTSYIAKDPEFLARIYNSLGANYNSLEMFTLASQNVLKAVDILNKINPKDNGLLHNQSANYTQLAYIYVDLKKTDSAYHYLKEGEKVLNQITSPGIFRQKALSDINFGDHFYLLKKYDSARYYYTRALSKFNGEKHLYKVGAVLGIANVDNDENELDDAILNYSQVLGLVKKNKLSYGLSEAYEGLELVYEKKSDYKKAHQYKVSLQKLNDSVANITKIQRDSLIHEIIQFEKKEQEQKSNTNFVKIALVVSLIIILLSVGVFYFVKRKRKKLIIENENRIKEKENIIIEKEEETQSLKQKVNESFEEVVQLAKDNSPEFFTRFKEVYPDIVAKILKIDPQLRVTELTLCAYFFLGFTPKDVAVYTFKSVHTVRNRRQNLRNKLQVPADESFDIWFKNL